MADIYVQYTKIGYNGRQLPAYHKKIVFIYDDGTMETLDGTAQVHHIDPYFAIVAPRYDANGQQDTDPGAYGALMGYFGVPNAIQRQQIIERIGGPQSEHMMNGTDEDLIPKRDLMAERLVTKYLDFKNTYTPYPTLLGPPVNNSNTLADDVLLYSGLPLPVKDASWENLSIGSIDEPPFDVGSVGEIVETVTPSGLKIRFMADEYGRPDYSFRELVYPDGKIVTLWSKEKIESDPMLARIGIELRMTMIDEKNGIRISKVTINGEEHTIKHDKDGNLIERIIVGKDGVVRAEINVEGGGDNSDLIINLGELPEGDREIATEIAAELDALDFASQSAAFIALHNQARSLNGQPVVDALEPSSWEVPDGYEGFITVNDGRDIEDDIYYYDVSSLFGGDGSGDNHTASGGGSSSGGLPRVGDTGSNALGDFVWVEGFMRTPSYNPLSTNQHTRSRLRKEYVDKKEENSSKKEGGASTGDQGSGNSDGEDTLQGGGSDDTLAGGSGNDTPGAACFPAGTLVQLPDGAEAPIESIAEGQMVAAFAGAHDAPVPARVAKTFRHEDRPLLRLTLDDGTVIDTTDEHPFLTADNEFVPAAKLTPGTKLVRANGQPAILKSTENTGERSDVFNFEVAELHTYIAAGMRVHNKAGDATPVVLDLDGDGVELVNLKDSPVFFDIDDDGFLERTGWAGADDGILAIDLGNDGVIDQAQEFVFVHHAPGARSDLAAVQQAFDSNNDLVLDAADARWSDFRIWRDQNQNGISEAGEVSRPEDWGIQSLSLESVPDVTQDVPQHPDENVLLGQSYFTRADSNIGRVADVVFKFSTFGFAIGDAQAGQDSTGGVILHGEDDTNFLKMTGGEGISLDIGQAGLSGFFGGDGFDRVSGVLAGYDLIMDGGGGADILEGGIGQDWISGGAGADILYGGRGNDVLFFDAVDIDVDGGEGIDVAIVSGDAGVELDLRFQGLEVIYGGGHDDSFRGNGNQEALALFGGAGDDLLQGGDAGDQLVGGSGADTLAGGAGDDSLYVDAADVVFGGDGTDHVYWAGAEDINLNASALQAENLRAGGGNDTLVAGGDQAVVLNGADGDDCLIGGAGDDVLIGGDGNDLLLGDTQENAVGSGGTDRAVFEGRREWYEINELGDGRFEIVDKRPEFWGDEGRDTVEGVEILEFLDRRIYLDGTNNAPDGDAWSWARTFIDTPFVIGADELTAQASDFDGDTFTVGDVGSARHGNVTKTSDGSILFAPEAGFSGEAEFRYELVDENGAVSVEVAHITVSGEKPADPLFAIQYHHKSIDVLDVWEDYTGKGFNVGLFGQGVDYSHSDLDDNYNHDLDYDFTRNVGDGSPVSARAGHETTTAGIVAGERNGEGVVGIAYDAQISGVHLGSGDHLSSAYTWQDDANAMSYRARFDVSTHAYQTTNVLEGNYFYGTNLDPLPETWRATALEHVARTGRDGLGSSQVFGAGNHASLGLNVNGDNAANSRFGIAVGGLDQYGVDANYSRPGAAMLLTAPGREIYTTDAALPYGYTDQDYVSLGGTSASGPVVAAIVALMLEANPELGYRDVQAILALTAVKNDPDHAGWADNGASNHNGGGMHFNHEYGFGMVDAHAAVRLAETWTKQNVHANEVAIAMNPVVVGQAIPDGGVLESRVIIDDDISVEHVEVVLHITHQRIGDLVVTLISPDGTESVLVDRPGKNPLDDDARGSTFNTILFQTMTVASWGENGQGEWTLRVEDKFGGDATGTLHSWTPRLFGSPATDTDNVYVYTDDYADFDSREDADRRVLTDDDGGIDAINASGSREDQNIDLRPGRTSIIAGNTVTIDQNTIIEQAYSSDGQDTISGNGADNLLNGGRGDDVIFSGESGADTLAGAKGDDTLVALRNTSLADGGDGFDVVDFRDVDVAVTATDISGVYVEADQFVDVEKIILSDGADLLKASLLDHSAQEILGGTGDDTIAGGAGADTLAGESGDDELNGGLDDDTYLFTNGRDVIAETALNEVVTTFDEAYTEYQTTQTWVDQGEGSGYWTTTQTPITKYRTVENREVTEVDGGQDVLMFGDGVGITDLLLQQTGPDLILALKSGDTAFVELTDQILIRDWLNTDRRVEEIGFANGTRLDLTSLLQTFGDGTDAVIDLAAAMDELFDAGIVEEVVVGTGSDDAITGGDSGDGIAGGAGDDTLSGGAGNDVIFGGDGDDLIEGGQGADTIDGGNGNDTVSYQSSGNNGVTIILDSGDEIGYSIEGDGSQDQLTNIENVIGSNGADSIVGSDGDNELSGAGGDDTISGEGGNDTLNGDAGDDELNGGAGADEINGGNGNDTADYQGSDSGVNVDLGAGTGSGGDAEGDTLTGIENVTGSDSDDTLTGDAGDNQLDGQGGHDLIISTSGNDTLIGGQGADYLGGGAGDDVYRFSDGIETVLDEVTVSEVRTEEETYTAYRTELVWSDVGEGYESVLVAYQATRTTEYTVEVGGDGGQDTLELGPGITADDLVKQLVSRTIQTSDGDIQVRDLVIGLKDPAQPAAAASELSNRITLSRWTEPEYRIEYVKFADGTRQQLDIPASAWGTEGDDEIALAPGGGVLHTHGGDDIVRGSTGDDVIFGDAGNDTIQGDAGNDLLNGGTGADFINGGAGDDTVSYDGASSAVTVNLQSLTASGGDAEGDRLVSIEHARGSARDDQLIAAQSGSHLVGGAGADTLAGNDSADTLAGGDDDDLLTGGLGSDVYVFDGGIDRALDEALVTETRSVEETYTAYQTTNTWIDTGEGGGYWQTTSTPYQATRMVDVDVDVAVDAGVDTLRLGGDILPSDLVFELVSHPLQTVDDEITAQDLVVALRDPAQPHATASTLADRIVLENWSVDEYRIEKLMFADGQAMDIGALIMAGVTAGTDNVSVTASAIVQASGGDDTVQGSTSDDQLFGGTGDDQLHGAAGIDILAGGGGADQLDGGTGNDYISGGSGNDTLTGGSGNDRFIFDVDVQATDVDEITDFTLGQDLIQLDDGLGVAAFDDLADGSGTVLDLDNGARIHLLGITGLTGVDQLGL